MLLIAPADVLRPRRPDEHFADEVAAARRAGIDVALVDHDALAGGGDPGPAVARVPPSEDAVYRGWMLSAAAYLGFAGALAARGVTLRTDGTQYRRAHELPGWYEALRAVTPESVWTTGDTRTAFDDARARLGGGPAVLRDYTKSMKHYWEQACFIPDLADADAAWSVAARFRELREDVEGGFVLRCFEDFTGVECRTWWIGGRCVHAGPHPDEPAGDVQEPDLAAITPLVAGLGLLFVTVDVVRRADGAWRVVELGDGQVSDRPAGFAADDLLAALQVTGG